MVTVDWCVTIRMKKKIPVQQTRQFRHEELCQARRYLLDDPLHPPRQIIIWGMVVC